MEIQSLVKNCYCFHRSFKGDAAKAEALNRFSQEERLWRDKPRNASVSLANPPDAEYFWALMVIHNWSEARILEAVDPGTSADPRHRRISFEVVNFDPLVEWVEFDQKQIPPLQTVPTERRELEYKQICFGNSEPPFGYWIRVS